MTRSTQDKVNAYGANQQIQIDGRETDKRALLNCANRLKTALDDGGKDMSLYQSALRHNQHLWTIFQVALTDPGNQLASDLKITLLRLSGFVDQVSFKNISRFSERALRTLIELNRTIAGGLGRKAPEQDTSMPMHSTPAPIAGTPATVRTSA